MASTSSIFNGGSRYASDFQSVINRSVAIASLPLSQLNSQKTTLENQSAAIGSLDTKVTALRTAIETINTAINPGAYDLSSSNAGVGTASLGTTVLEGSYRINVTEIGSQSIAVSNAGLPAVSDPATQSISSAASLTLTVDGEAHTITPASGGLTALAEAINLADAGVSATIVNLGSGSSPQYRLSLQSEKYAPVSISLAEGTTQLLAQVVTGVKASYQINGIPTPVDTDTRSITLAPGLLVKLTGQGEATFSVSRSRSAIQNGLSAFVKAYNAAVDELDTHRGSGKGALAGQSLLLSVGSLMRSVAQYATSPAAVDSLTKLGIEFDREGHLSLNTSTFDALAADQFDALKSFLGNQDSGGFLKAARTGLDGLMNEGIIDSALSTVKDQIKAQQARIDEVDARMDVLRKALEGQFAAADSLIAGLEQRVLFVQGLFASYFGSDK